MLKQKKHAMGMWWYFGAGRGGINAKAPHFKTSKIYESTSNWFLINKQLICDDGRSQEVDINGLPQVLHTNT